MQFNFAQSSPVSVDIDGFNFKGFGGGRVNERK